MTTKSSSRKPITGTVNDGRDDAVHVGGTVVQFKHRSCGHVWCEDFWKRQVPKRIGEAGVRILVRGWKTTGVITACPKCKRSGK